MRRGCTEQHDRRELGERLNQRGGRALGKVVRRLERDRDVEPAVERQRLGEVVTEELVRIDAESLRSHVGPVDAEDVLDPVLTKDLQPPTRAAADVDDAAWVEPLDDEGNDDAGRPLRRIALPAEIGGVEILGGVPKTAQ
jgi:hypothetical protein